MDLYVTDLGSTSQTTFDFLSSARSEPGAEHSCGWPPNKHKKVTWKKIPGSGVEDISPSSINKVGMKKD